MVGSNACSSQIIQQITVVYCGLGFVAETTSCHQVSVPSFLFIKRILIFSADNVLFNDLGIVYIGGLSLRTLIRLYTYI